MKHGHNNILVALAGQPNCGKSTVFNMLTGSRQHVANFPGVTVEKKEGHYREGDARIELVDLPGTYSLTSYSLEERVARDFLLLERPEVLVAVVDASNLERHLYLIFQLREMRIPMVLCLNMLDVATRRGISVDADALSRLLAVPVVTTIARRNEGCKELKAAIRDVAESVNHVPEEWRIDYSETLEPTLKALEDQLAACPHLAEEFSPRWLAVKLLEHDPEAMRIVQHHIRATKRDEILNQVESILSAFQEQYPESAMKLIAAQRYETANMIIRTCTQHARGGAATRTDRIDHWLCHPYLGPVVAFLSIYIMFELTFCLSDGWAWIPWLDGWTTPVGVFSWFFDECLPRLTTGMAESPLKSMLTDGIIAGVGGVMGFVPIIFFMFLFLAVIEDSGYIARIAFVMDRLMRVFGLQGQSVLPLIISGGVAGGCAVPGVMATRTMRDPHDRLVTMLVAPFMNCGAKIPVYAVLTAAFFSAWKGAMLWLLTALAWIIALLVAWVLRRTIARGEESMFVIELPPYHLPTLRAMLRSAGTRSWQYLKKAGTVILAVSVLLWGIMNYPGIDTSPYEARHTNAVQHLQATLEGTQFSVLVAESGLAVTDHFLADYASARDSDDPHRLLALRQQDPLRFSLAETVFHDTEQNTTEDIEPAHEAYTTYLDTLDLIQRDEAKARLKSSLAGRIGHAMEKISFLAGFDWHDNIALLGGFAAKEVIVSSLATSYSLDAPMAEMEDGEDLPPLAKRLRANPDWTPLRAFALMLFILLYAPCVATVAVIWRESGSWKWAAFSVLYSTGLAFLLAALVFQVGNILRIGI